MVSIGVRTAKPNLAINHVVSLSSLLKQYCMMREKVSKRGPMEVGKSRLFAESVKRDTQNWSVARNLGLTILTACGILLKLGRKLQYTFLYKENRVSTRNSMLSFDL